MTEGDGGRIPLFLPKKDPTQSMNEQQPNDPLHGVTPDKIVTVWLIIMDRTRWVNASISAASTTILW